MISNTAQPTVYPKPVSSYRRSKDRTETRFQVPAQIAADPALMKDLRKGIRKNMCFPSIIRVSRSTPSCIKLLTPGTQSPRKQIQSGYHDVLQICSSVNTLVGDFGYPAHMATRLANSNVSWYLLEEALERAKYGVTTVEEGRVIAMEVGTLLQHLGSECEGMNGSAEAGHALVGILQGMPQAIRTQTVMYLFDSNWMCFAHLSMQRLDPTVTASIRDLLTEAVDAHTQDPSRLSTEEAEQLRLLQEAAEALVPFQGAGYPTGPGHA